MRLLYALTNIVIVLALCNTFFRGAKTVPKKPTKIPHGRWQREIAVMPTKSKKKFPPEEVRRTMLAFYRAAKSMDRHPSMSTQADGSVIITLDTKRGAK
jgi:hypothetical protein